MIYVYLIDNTQDEEIHKPTQDELDDIFRADRILKKGD